MARKYRSSSCWERMAHGFGGRVKKEPHTDCKKSSEPNQRRKRGCRYRRTVRRTLSECSLYSCCAASSSPANACRNRFSNSVFMEPKASLRHKSTIRRNQGCASLPLIAGSSMQSSYFVRHETARENRADEEAGSANDSALFWR